MGASVIMAIADDFSIGDTRSRTGLPWPRLPQDLFNLYGWTRDQNLIIGHSTLRSVPPESPMLQDAASLQVLTKDTDAFRPPEALEGLAIQPHADFRDAYEAAGEYAKIVGGRDTYLAALNAGVVSHAVITLVHMQAQGDIGFPLTLLGEEYNWRRLPAAYYEAEGNRPAFTIQQRVRKEEIPVDEGLLLS